MYHVEEEYKLNPPPRSGHWGVSSQPGLDHCNLFFAFPSLPFAPPTPPNVAFDFPPTQTPGGGFLC